MSRLFLVLSPPNTTHALEAQGYTQGSRTGKDGVFTTTGESRGCRQCYVPTSVTTKEVGLHVRCAGTGIYSKPTQIGRHIIMG